MFYVRTQEERSGRVRLMRNLVIHSEKILGEAFGEDPGDDFEELPLGPEPCTEADDDLLPPD